MKAYGGMDVYIHIFLASALAGGEWSASRPYPFTPGERVPSTHWIGAGRIRSVEKSSDLIVNRTHHLPACSTVPQPTTLSGAPILSTMQIYE
jgi:hypothetical protein